MKWSTLIRKTVLASALPATITADLLYLAVWKLSKKQRKILPFAVGIYLAAWTYVIWYVCVADHAALPVPFHMLFLSYPCRCTRHLTPP
jgi:hypothetical protein